MCYDEINMDLQQIHEWATANGLKLNPKKRQVILIHRSRADIPPPTLLIGANVVKVVPRMRNLGFVLIERLIRLRIILGRCVRGFIGLYVL
jgi:hypothetical protein